MINKGFSDLSCNGEKYEKAKPLFQTALNKSGYKTAMTNTKTKKHKNETEHAILYGLIHLVIKMLKPTLEKHFSSK